MTMTIKIKAMPPTTAAAIVSADLPQSACDGTGVWSNADVLVGGFSVELISWVDVSVESRIEW